jgi:hypothetical protein
MSPILVPLERPVAPFTDPHNSPEPDPTSLDDGPHGLRD